MNIEIAYQIEKLKKDGMSDKEIAKKLSLSPSDVFYTRRALGIESLPGGAGKQVHIRVYDRGGNFIMEGTRTEVGKRLHYSKRSVARWELDLDAPYRVERVVDGETYGTRRKINIDEGDLS